jgi:hypothetical protein
LVRFELHCRCGRNGWPGSRQLRRISESGSSNFTSVVHVKKRRKREQFADIGAAFDNSANARTLMSVAAFGACARFIEGDRLNRPGPGEGAQLSDFAGSADHYDAFGTRRERSAQRSSVGNADEHHQRDLFRFDVSRRVYWIVGAVAERREGACDVAVRCDIGRPERR